MSTESGSRDVLARLSRLERQNRRMKLGIVAMLVVVVGLASVAAYRPRVVAANEFVLRDELGRPRARLGFSDPGRPRLGFYDTKGRVRVVLGFSRRTWGPALEFRDAEGRGRVTLWFDPHFDAGLAFSDECGEFRASMGYALEGATLWAPDEWPGGNPAEDLLAPAHAWVTVCDPSVWAGPFWKGSGVAMRATEGHGGTLTTYDNEGRPSWGAP